MITSERQAAVAGKCRRLSRLADLEGRFAMIAVDQRKSLQAMFLGNPDAEEQRRALKAVKRVVAKTIAPLSTAILTDPVYGFPNVLEHISAGVGLILALEVSGYETAGEYERRSSLLAGFDVKTAAAAGVDGVKLLIWHHPDASSKTQQHQNDIVRSVGMECRTYGMPFILEIVTYGLGNTKTSSDYIRGKPALVLDGVQTYSSPEFGVDLFKVQFPGDLKYTQEFQDKPYAQGSVFFTSEEILEYCRKLDQAASAPWVILSAGVKPEEFIENVRIANSAGASGFLCGRVVWKNVVQYVPDEHAMIRFMKASGCNQFRRIREANEDAHPWFGRTPLGPSVGHIRECIHPTNPTS